MWWRFVGRLLELLISFSSFFLFFPACGGHVLVLKMRCSYSTFLLLISSRMNEYYYIVG